MTNRPLKKEKLRNNEYYDTQEVFDKLYQQSLNDKTFKNLMPLIVNDNNIDLTFRNLKTNDGRNTPGTDGKTIVDYEKMDRVEFRELIKRKFENYFPKSIKRVEIPKSNGGTRPLGMSCMIARLSDIS